MSKGNPFVQEALITSTSLAIYPAFLLGLRGDSLPAATALPENTVTAASRSPTHSGARANTARIHQLNRHPSWRQHHPPAAESSSKRRPRRRTRPSARRSARRTVPSPWTGGGRRLPGGKTAPRLRRRRANWNRPASGHAAVAVRAQDPGWRAQAAGGLPRRHEKSFAHSSNILPRRYFIFPNFKFRPGNGVFWGGVGGVLCT